MVKQAERREATRGAIIRAATTLFGRNGFAATTVDELAEKAGVAKGAVYHHFATKEVLFEAVFEAVSQEVSAQVATAARKAPDLLASIGMGTKAYFKICSEGATGRIILGDGPQVLGWQRWREIDSRHFGAVFPHILEAAIAQGLIDKQPVVPMANLLLGAVTEAAVACANSKTPKETGQYYAEAFERLLAGLRRPTPPAKKTPRKS
tara:strand:+ start:4929 stop:5549 length:621 start_codon:yes stop_codon:yes gene_type:complete